jgi:HlyD family secretion protein
LARSEAELDQRQREFERAEQLFETQALNEAEYGVAEYNLAVARANHRTAEVSLERAQRNLAYSVIRAPINGVVIERNVDVGQTVAASLSAPQLFLIAEDLSQMEILVSVDESDIGLIREGQAVRFMVQAYPDVTFDGTVRQVRLQSTTAENVVNYTVVVDVVNDSGKLLPGMTATVDFVIETATNVFRVSNAALRFRPTDEMIAQVQARRAEGEDASDRLSAPAPTGSGSGRPGSGARRGDGSGSSLLWTVDNSGTLNVSRVRAGVTDGRFTEITGNGIEAGMQVIVGVVHGEQASSSSPFQTQQPQVGPRLPGS